MNLDELNELSASAWTADDKAQILDGIVRGANGSEAPASAPPLLLKANAVGLRWRREAESFLEKAVADGIKSAEARRAKHGTAQPPSAISRTPFEESSNQATSHKLQAVKEQQQETLALLAGDLTGGATESGAGKASAKARAEKYGSSQPVTEQCSAEDRTVFEDSSNQTLSLKPQTENKEQAQQIPDVLNTEAFLKKWDEWLHFRKVEKKQKVTVTTAKLQLAKLASVGVASAIEAIDRSMECGYVGLFPDRKQSDFQKTRRPTMTTSIRPLRDGESPDDALYGGDPW